MGAQAFQHFGQQRLPFQTSDLILDGFGQSCQGSSQLRINHPYRQASGQHGRRPAVFRHAEGQLGARPAFRRARVRQTGAQGKDLARNNARVAL